MNEQLTRHPEIDASEIEVRVKNGEVTLTGTVEERHMKRMVEDLVEQASGVTEVHNQIRVSRGGLSGGGSMSDREISRGTEREGASGSESRNRGRSGTTTGATAGSSSGGSGTSSTGGNTSKFRLSLATTPSLR